MKLRTSDPSYVKAVEKWYSLLLPKLVPMLYKNGGPVIMVQIENEYGFCYACDYAYTSHLRDLHINYFGKDVQLFTTDSNGDHYLKCGQIDNVLATVDFGSNVDPVQAFKLLRAHQKSGPSVNSEYYTGWIDHWERPHSTATSQQVCKTLDAILALNASVNLYPLHGGTSFGFGSGADLDDNVYDPCITSYDFNAPLTEDGDPTQKYFDVRKVIGKYLPLPNVTLPVPSPKMETKPIVMKPILSIYDIISSLTPIESVYPLSFEKLRIKDGFILYSTNITFNPSNPAVLAINELKDRAQVFVNQKYVGTLSRTHNIHKIDLNIALGSQLDLFVENQGRFSFGDTINELKGITSNVTIGSVVVEDWSHYLVFKNWTKSMADIHYYSDAFSTHPTPAKESSFDRIPSFYTSDFVLPDTKGYPFDTFLRLDGWHKGIAFLNGFNLGRYWTVGPQITLYSPKHLFNAYPKANKLLVFELESPSNSKTVQFVTQSVLNATNVL
ncbi:unnamed protein product [Oppiella nova]|uniref:Beta-galactosidase n=1 Tax=Oppiella nova TaxID=334625 RepID=A0A7R9QNV5_9ACAR|nr:unnamed protein product [Oppiella nova]CAG2169545.1 unnamed protein product [Oppiella nova]